MDKQREKRIKTSVTVDESLWKSFDIQCTHVGLTLGSGMDEAIRSWLREPRKSEVPPHLKKVVELLKERFTSEEKVDALFSLLKNALKLAE